MSHPTLEELTHAVHGLSEGPPHVETCLECRDMISRLEEELVLLRRAESVEGRPRRIWKWIPLAAASLMMLWIFGLILRTDEPRLRSPLAPPPTPDAAQEEQAPKPQHLLTVSLSLLTTSKNLAAKAQAFNPKYEELSARIEKRVRTLDSKNPHDREGALRELESLGLQILPKIAELQQGALPAESKASLSALVSKLSGGFSEDPARVSTVVRIPKEAVVDFNKGLEKEGVKPRFIPNLTVFEGQLGSIVAQEELPPFVNQVDLIFAGDEKGFACKPISQIAKIGFSCVVQAHVKDAAAEEVKLELDVKRTAASASEARKVKTPAGTFEHVDVRTLRIVLSPIVKGGESVLFGPLPSLEEKEAFWILVSCRLAK
ncbi:MAG: hypothetical protein HY716_09570 [Planctomycetes bacterium]|nr:hypothetical protein [Planctomycetota bacterium]